MCPRRNRPWRPSRQTRAAESNASSSANSGPSPGPERLSSSGGGARGRPGRNRVGRRRRQGRLRANRRRPPDAARLLVPIVAVAFGYRAILGDRRRGRTRRSRHVSDRASRTRPRRLRGQGRWPSRYGRRPAVTRRRCGLRRSRRAVQPVCLPRRCRLPDPVRAVRCADGPVRAVHPRRCARHLSARGGTRSALALSVVALVVLLVGLDLALVYGFTNGYLADSSLVHALAVSPSARIADSSSRAPS